MVLSYTRCMMQKFLTFRDSPIIPLRRSAVEVADFGIACQSVRQLNANKGRIGFGWIERGPNRHHAHARAFSG